MNITDNRTETIEYMSQGTCCKVMQVALCDGVIKDVDFIGGCAGNLEAIKQLIKGMSINDVVAKLKGIKCGAKATSCPDQLAVCLTQYLSQKETSKV